MEFRKATLCRLDVYNQALQNDDTHLLTLCCPFLLLFPAPVSRQSSLFEEVSKEFSPSQTQTARMCCLSTTYAASEAKGAGKRDNHPC